MANLMLRDEDLVSYQLKQGVINVNLDPNFMTINFLPDDAILDLPKEKRFVLGNIILPTTEKTKELIPLFVNRLAGGKDKILDQRESINLLIKDIDQVNLSKSLKNLLGI